MATNYVVLRADVANQEQGVNGLHRWVLLEEGDSGSGPLVIDAASDIAAIKAAEGVVGAKFDDGAVAIPLRSWRPRTPKDENRPRRLWT